MSNFSTLRPYTLVDCKVLAQVLNAHSWFGAWAKPLEISRIFATISKFSLTIDYVT